MLYAIVLMTILCTGLDAINYLERKEALKKAEAEGYEVFFRE